MIHPATELRFIDDETGYGVVATQFIPKGTVTWVLDKLDRQFTPQQIADFEPAYQALLDKYCYRNNQGNFILCWDLGRFVNHSFRSNCLSTAYNLEIAVRDIHPGEQLTDDYGYLNLTQAFRATDEGSRRKWVYPDDLLRYHRSWDRQLQAAFPYLPNVEQPLLELIDQKTWAHCLRIAQGEAPMDSIKSLYFDPDSLKKPAKSRHVNGKTAAKTGRGSVLH